MIAVVLASGLLIGLSLGALGGGGSILTVPVLVYLVGQDPKAATTSSLVIVGISALIGAVGHARSDRVRWGIGLGFGISGIAAGFLGTMANRLVDPDVLLLAFAGLIVVAAAGMLAKARRTARADAVRTPALVGAGGGAAGVGTDAEDAADARRARRARLGRIVAAGLLVGFLTGFFGVGGGFVIVPALAVALALPMPEAVATSLLVIAINSVAALAARAGTAAFDWSVIVPFTLAAVAGSLLGKKVADRLSGPAMTRAFAALMIGVAVYTGVQSILALTG